MKNGADVIIEKLKYSFSAVAKANERNNVSRCENWRIRNEFNKIQYISERNTLVVFLPNLKHNSCSFHETRVGQTIIYFTFFAFIFAGPLFDESSRKNWVLLLQTTFAFELQLFNIYFHFGR